MIEKVPSTPVVEIRETFTPSERLRDVLADFLDPDLDQHTRESLRAAFLFKSWRRRVIERNEYYQNEHDKNGSVREASVRFANLPHLPIPLTDRVGMLHGTPIERLVFQTSSTPSAARASEILQSIPNVEAKPDSLETANLYYVDIAKRSLALWMNVEAVSFMIGQSIANSTDTTRLTITPASIVTKSSFAEIYRRSDGQEATETAS